MKRSDRGLIAFGIIFILLFITTTLALLSNQTVSLIKSLQVIDQSNTLKKELLHRLFRESSSSYATSSKENSTRSEVSLTLRRALVSESDSLYLLDFIRGESCEDFFSHIYSPIHSKITAQDNSVISLHTCKADNILINENTFTTTNNLEADKLKFLTHNEPYKIQTNGYLAISTLLQFDNDLLVISGGSIYIEKLQAINDSHVSIISLSGEIVLKDVNGDLDIFTDALLGTELPNGIISRESSPLITPISGWIAGYN